MLGNRIKENLKLKTPKGKNFVRFGRDFDGGYVIVDDLCKDDFLVSMGVCDDVSFEKDTQELVAGIHLYDHTIDGLPEQLDNSTFFKEKIGNESTNIFNRIPEDKDIILKIDIEGSEWDFFRSLSDEEMNRIRQIALEIHWFIPEGTIGVPDCPIDVIQKINKTHQLVAIHPNNNSRTVIVNKKLIVPQVMELTFLRKNSYDFNDYGSNPTSLFQINNPELPDIEEYL